MLIKEMPRSERPRERLQKLGKKALSTKELIAILISTGTKDKSAKELAAEVYNYLNDISDLNNLEVEELLQIKGIKLAKAATIIAAVELGRRLQKTRTTVELINSSLDVYNLLSLEMETLTQEHFIVLYLNTKSQIIKKKTIFIGTINQTMIHPREIFTLAIKLNSTSLIIIHNHPSGNSEPSRADILVTKQLVKASELIGISIIDHIIIGKNEFYSIMNNTKEHIY